MAFFMKHCKIKAPTPHNYQTNNIWSRYNNYWLHFNFQPQPVQNSSTTIPESFMFDLLQKYHKNEQLWKMASYSEIKN